MSRRYVILVVIIVLVTASLAAVAAMGTIATPTLQVTPQSHREGTEGYFRLTVPLPDHSPPLPLAVLARVADGDAWLVTAQAPLSVSMNHIEGDEESPPSAKREVIVTGRFGKPGPVRLTIMGRSANESFKPVMNLSFRTTGGEIVAPGVRTAWAQMQQDALASADPRGEDSYSHYWNLAIAPSYGLTPRWHASTGRQRRDPPDLYSVFTGAAAIQESLQLELLGSGPQTAAQQESVNKGVNAAAELLPLAGLTGPSVKSHPFREMLKGRTPQVPPLATYIPEDQYAVFFSDINRQIELADLMDEWGGNLLHQVEASARDFQVRRKVSRQLCLENSWLTRMFGDRVIADMAFTGNDPFLKEGTAFTVLFTLKDATRFRKQMERQYAEAVKVHGAKRSSFTIDGTSGFSAVSPDREISSHTLIMGNTAIVSTSLQSLQRISDVSSKRIPSLAASDDFRYMRTVFPQDNNQEDIFIYLSDAHIRTLVGPRWKIGEARRMRCSGNMALLANARLWYKAEQRREPTMAELVSGGFLGKSQPVCPDHGRYEFDRAGQPCCSLHNRQGLLTPVGDVELSQVTAQEAVQYKAFVENYNHYWTRFFDPIGIRVKMGKDIRIQTCILPLIENSWYDGLAAFSGRKAGELTEGAVLPRTIMSVRGHVDQQWLNKTRLTQKLGTRNLKLDWLGDEIALNLCDGQVLFSTGGRAMGLMGQEMGRSSLEPLIFGYLGSAINLPTYLTVKVTDSIKAEQSIPGLFRALAPGHDQDGEFSVDTYSIEDYHGKPLYVASFNLWILKLRLYSAVVGDRLVIASRRDIVTDLMNAQASGAGGKADTHEGNMELSVYRSAFKQLEETVNLGWQEDLRHACHQNLPLASILLKSFGLAPDSFASTVAGLRGYQPYCPSGGRYVVDGTTGAVICTLHGTSREPKQPPASDKSSKTMELVNSLERVNARLAFTPQGLMTTVDIRRGGK
jgi:hypothetical protein